MILGDIIFGEAIFGSPLGGGAASTDPVFVSVIIRDATNRITYLYENDVRPQFTAGQIVVKSPERTWVRISK